MINNKNIYALYNVLLTIQSDLKKGFQQESLVYEARLQSKAKDDIDGMIQTKIEQAYMEGSFEGASQAIVRITEALRAILDQE